MNIIKKVILKILLPLSLIASLATVAWVINDNYYQAKVSKYHKIDNVVVRKNTKRYVDYAFTKGKITIDNATT